MTINLEAIKAREEAASPGPWPERAIELAFWIIREKGPPILGGQGARDIDLLAHARADIPALIAEIERLRAMLGERQYYTTGMAEAIAAVVAEYDVLQVEVERLRKLVEGTQ